MPGAVGTSPGERDACLERRTRRRGGGEGDPFLLILSPGIPGFGTGRLSLGCGRRPSLVHVLGHQPREHDVPKCTGRALSVWPPSKPLPPQPPCPTFPSFLAPPPSSTLTSPLSPAPSPPLKAAGPGYRGDYKAGQPGLWEQVRAAGVLDPFVYARNKYGSVGGRARIVCVRGDYT